LLHLHFFHTLRPAVLKSTLAFFVSRGTGKKPANRHAQKSPAPFGRGDFVSMPVGWFLAVAAAHKKGQRGF
ncbi:MAG: hypothetical protein SOX38_02520, partial [Candidatus Limiplasma sp.]|nr:hypothetical protein [Candidatus Limiplasma sp.]